MQTKSIYVFIQVDPNDVLSNGILRFSNGPPKMRLDHYEL